MKELQHYLAEARRQDLVYQEKKVKDKIEKTKETLDKVSVSLTGAESGTFTKLIKDYVSIEKDIENLSEKRGKLNAEMKDRAEDLFDATDIYATRIIETTSATLQLSKAALAKRGDDKVDYEAAFRALLELMPELKEKGEELIKAYTTPGELGKPKASALTIKDVKEAVELDEAVAQNLFKLFSDTFRKLKRAFTVWGRQYDSKLKRILQKAKLV